MYWIIGILGVASPKTHQILGFFNLNARILAVRGFERAGELFFVYF
jgi:hypothetical protein